MNPQPVRIRRSRAKGSKLTSPNGLPVMCVTRPSIFGNPHIVGPAGDAQKCVLLYAVWLALAPGGAPVRARIPELRGLNLACYCALCDVHAAGLPLGADCDDCGRCHADVLLSLANPPEAD